MAYTQCISQAEDEHIADFGTPKFFTPGPCPDEYKYLHYGTIVSSELAVPLSAPYVPR